MLPLQPGGAEQTDDDLGAAILVPGTVAWRKSSPGQLGLQQVEVEGGQHGQGSALILRTLHLDLHDVLAQRVEVIHLAFCLGVILDILFPVLNDILDVILRVSCKFS